MKRAIEEPALTDQLECALTVPIPDLATHQWPKFCLQGLNSAVVEERIKAKQQQLVVQSLTNRLDAETDTDTKAMIILLLEKCCHFPNVNAQHIFQRLLSQLGTESTKVKYLIYNCMGSILKRRRINTEKEAEILFDHLIADLSNTHHKVRAAAIPLLSLMPSAFRKNTMSPMEIQKMVSHYAQDHEPRVRKSALDSLVQMHLRGCPLDLSIYQLSVSALRDDYEEVRMGGLNLMGVLSSLYPEHRMKLDHEQLDETVRLIDDAFNKVCDLVNDATVVIRTKACVMMASYQNVGSDMLQQTFSKQIMSHLKRNIPRYKQQQKKYANGVIPVAEGDFDVESDEFHILDSGACGAFIHGLEDEYQEVRYASIDSICELCMYNEELTKKAVENLVDMFNDEIDKIRVNAIQSLRKIGTRSLVQLDEEQLEIAVGAFEDSDPMARHASHDLLTVVRLTQKSSLATLLEALEANMKRYPQDTLSIYRSLGKIGKRHDDYMEHLTPSLLKLDRRYLPREANVDDLMYTAYVILIANACVFNHKLLRTLPKYIFRHFAYFKSKYPECLPNLRKLYKTAGIQLEGDVDCLPMTFSESEKKRVSSDAEIYMKATENMLETLQITLHKKSQYDVSLTTLDAAARNFKYVASLKPVDSGKSELAQLYIECYKIMIRMKQSHLSGNFSSAVQKDAALLFQYAYTIEYTFLGLPIDTLHAAAQFRVLGNMVWLFSVLKHMSNSFDIKNMLTATLKRVELVQKRFQQNSLDSLCSDLKKAIESPNTESISALYSFITTFLPLPIPLKNLVKQSSAVITSPIANPDKPYSYISAYPLKLDVEADVFNIDDVNSIAVEVVLPNQSSQVFWPSPRDFRPNTPLNYTLSTYVELQLPVWQSTNAISIRIIISFEPDLPGLDEYIMAPGRTASSVISESVNYRVHPQ